MKNLLSSRPAKFSLAVIATLSILQACAPAIVGGAATGVAMATDRRTAGTVLDDHSIEVKALNTLSKNETLWKSSHLTVVCYNNILLLVGQTPSPELKQLAEQAVASIPRVRQLHNELSVQEPSSLGARTQDSWITTQIKAKLLSNREIQSRHLKVLTENSIVYLMGLVTPQEEPLIVDIASQVSGVEKVVKIFEPAPAT
jgi:osmotically-inducible protein OsmY